MSSEITLVRHGPSAHLERRWLDAAGFRRWREDYEAAGILAHARPPAALVELAARARALVSSDAPRAVASAQLLAPGREVLLSPLLRELDLLAPSLGRLAMPLPGWALAVGLRALLLRARSLHPAPAELARVREASRWLADVASPPGGLVAVTHASLRPLVVRELVAAGWTTAGRQGGLRSWSTWTLVRGARSRRLGRD